MSFGLSNAPVAFQQFINKIFGDLLNIYIVIYLDNILIYSNNIKNYQGHIKKVLQCLQAYKLYALPTKCTFYKESIEFLEFVLGPKDLTIDEQKNKNNLKLTTFSAIKKNSVVSRIFKLLSIVYTQLFWYDSPSYSSNIEKGSLGLVRRLSEDI